LEDLVAGTDVSDVESRLTDVEDRLSNMCDQFYASSIPDLEDVYTSAC
jgi:hypothetical protein